MDGSTNGKPKQRLYPNPDPAEYLSGILTNGLLGIKLFRYRGSEGQPTMELEFVHWNFLISVNIPYIVTHAHTSLPYSTELSIFDIVPKIARYGSTDGYSRYDGLISYFVINPHGVPVSNDTQIIMNQLNQSLEMYSTYPSYHEHVYHGPGSSWDIQWFLDYLYVTTGKGYTGQVAPLMMHSVEYQAFYLLQLQFCSYMSSTLSFNCSHVHTLQRLILFVFLYTIVTVINFLQCKLLITAFQCLTAFFINHAIFLLLIHTFNSYHIHPLFHAYSILTKLSMK